MHASIALRALVLSSFTCAIISASAQNPPSSPLTQQKSAMHQSAPLVDHLKITFGDKSANFTPAQLAAMPQTSVTVPNTHTKASDTYTGVSVIDLLTQLGISAKPHGKELRLFVVFAGSDGYEVTFGVGELAPYIRDAPVIVADTENGKPLASDGPLKLISSGDKVPERWVRNLVEIRVLPAD